MSDSATRRTVWPNSEAISSAVSASITSPGFMIWPCFMKNLTTSTARSDMRCASSWMVMVSGSITSRTIFSRGSWCSARLNFSWRRRIDDSERARASSSDSAVFSVSLPRRRSSSPFGLTALAHFRLDDALQRPAHAAALGFLGIVFGGRHLDLRRAAARFFLGAAAGFGLGQQARFFLGLAARGFLALAAAALFVFGAALGVVGGAAAIFDLANLRAFERPAARLHLVVRQVR